MSSRKAPDEASRWERRLQRERLARKRAEELLETRSRELYESKQALEKAYSATVEVFASLVGGKSGRTSTSLRQLARDARMLAQRVGLSEERAQIVYLSALLCELGKLALPDEIVNKPLVELTVAERKTFRAHPRLAYDALLALPPLEAVAQTILGHCELYNGKGYPNRVPWDDITRESQVLCVVKDFDALRRGILLKDSLTETEAIEYLRSQRDTAYAGELVDQFVDMLHERAEHAGGHKELRLAPKSLRPGMLLTRDLANDKGVLILPAGQRLDRPLIEKLNGMQGARGIVVYVEEAAVS